MQFMQGTLSRHHFSALKALNILFNKNSFDGRRMASKNSLENNFVLPSTFRDEKVILPKIPLAEKSICEHEH